MIVDESTLGKNGKGPRNGKEELKDLREEMVANFKEQMNKEPSHGKVGKQV